MNDEILIERLTKLESNDDKIIDSVNDIKQSLHDFKEGMGKRIDKNDEEVSTIIGDIKVMKDRWDTLGTITKWFLGITGTVLAILIVAGLKILLSNQSP